MLSSSEFEAKQAELESKSNQQVTSDSIWSRLCGVFAQLVECCSNKFTGSSTQTETDSRKISHSPPSRRRRTWRSFFSFISKFFTRNRRRHFVNQEMPQMITNLPKYSSLEPQLSYDLEYEYSMKSKVRGIALIFNHEHFLMPEKTRRTGTDKDRDSIEKNLQRLKFDVRVFNDCNLGEIDTEIYRVSRLDHTKHDCLVVVVLTHGDERTIACYNSDYKIDRLIKPFTDSRCPSLRNKPRLYLIQACRGNDLDSGLAMHRNGIPRNDTNRYILRRARDVIDTVAGFWASKNLPLSNFALPPIEKDFLLVRSAMDGYASFRNPDNGSWFIQELCKELETNGKDEDILTLLTHVNWAISERESNPHKYKQILCISTMLTRRLYLR